MSYFDILERVAQPDHGEPITDPYLSLVAAIEKGIITSSAIERMARPEQEIHIGESLASGFLPNGSNAGLVADHNGKKFAYDHGLIQTEGDDIFIHPTPKTGVTDNGEVVARGVIFRGTAEGDMVPVAAAVDTYTQMGLASRLSRRESFTDRRIKMFLSGSLDNIPVIEAKEILPNGVVLGAFRKRIFAVGSPF